MKVIQQLCLAVLAVSRSKQGRTTNRFYSLANGGYHHHGGFLGGYYDFYKGSSDNPKDNFSNKYETEKGGAEFEDETHHFHIIRKPVFEEVDPRIILDFETTTNTDSELFFLQQLLNSFTRK